MCSRITTFYIALLGCILSYLLGIHIGAERKRVTTKVVQVVQNPNCSDARMK